MNPLARNNFAGRLLMALAAMTSICSMAACGSGNSLPVVNQVGFTTSSLTGTYVFTSQGADNSGNPLNVAGVLVSNGTGGITGGTIDVIDPLFNIAPNTPPSPAAQPITGGSYSVNSDGRGKASLASTYGTYVLDFVLTSTSHGLVTEFDGNGGGSGTLDLQTAVTSLSQLAGPYAFSLAGSDGNGGPFATAGAFTLDQNGNIVANTGIEDFNDNLLVNNESITGVASLGSGTGPGAIPLISSSFPNATFDFYPIDATHWKLIETDYADYLAGDVFTQTGASIPTNATMVFTVSGGVTAPVAAGGFFTYTGTSIAGTEDVNEDGTVVEQSAFTGAPGVIGSVGQRLVVTLANFNPGTQWVIYPTTSGGLLILETDDLNLTVGAAYAQQAGAALATSQAYGFNLSAFNASGDYLENDIAQFTTASSGFSGVVDISDNFATGAPALSSEPLKGTYTLDSPATGRGEATTTVNGVGYIGFNFYAVTSDQFLVLETDTTASAIGAQIGAGTFEAQSTPGGGGAAKPRTVVVHPVVHPLVRRK